MTPLYALLFLSGLAGLGYEVLWTRMLATGMGHEMPALLAVSCAYLLLGTTPSRLRDWVATAVPAGLVVSLVVFASPRADRSRRRIHLRRPAHSAPRRRERRLPNRRSTCRRQSRRTAA